MYDYIHQLLHLFVGLEYPHGHWFITAALILVFVVAPAWTIGQLGIALYRGASTARRRRARVAAVIGRPVTTSDDVRVRSEPSSEPADSSMVSSAATPVAHDPWKLTLFVARATSRYQVLLVLLSLLTLPAAWFLLDIPKHIINHALASPEAHEGMTFLGFHLPRLQLLIALCGSYLAVLTASGLVKFAATRIRGRASERLVRRLRLQIVRRSRKAATPEARASLAAVAVQEVEPIGYFGASLFVVPLIYGGTLLTSLVFLFVQNPALALSALIMLPVQLAVLPRLQNRLNLKVRERVYATRALTGLLTASETDPRGEVSRKVTSLSLQKQTGQIADLERVRVEISDLKGRLRGLYNYTSNLTPFFFFTVGGYLVVQGKLSLGALVAAIAAYREIAPALRELFDFTQNWSDAEARFDEVTRVIASG
ncbi:multidrug ABC transporter ATPase [Bosea sp. (in: a-proteobacteria)]|uniref:multidrug ABC transporter ATPase n=1 Tax=Bosea sp. (in: a-proteobacteria) TaxID=1871050 RepID=UPI002B489A2A|nr:multidrug ABC transporter ATPase [Bosea sp. (in: a-proteobacteria)]WRH56121.1 MAG: multidrug ABC transporter ATPase [Bosea sp. (in: a-proteobacteria)]